DLVGAEGGAHGRMIVNERPGAPGDGAGSAGTFRALTGTAGGRSIRRTLVQICMDRLLQRVRQVVPGEPPSLGAPRWLRRHLGPGTGPPPARRGGRSCTRSFGSSS